MHRIDAAGFAAGNLFTDGNPSTGTPATVVDAAWLNDLQENVCQVIEATGIVLVKGTYGQLLTALRAAGVFQTQAQFDNSSKVATTAFVKAAVGSYSGHNVVGTTTLTAANAGNVIACAGSSTITLPAASALLAGSAITIFAIGAAVVVQRSGADLIQPNGGTVTSITLNAGDTLVLESNGAAVWGAIGGSSQLGYASAFGSSQSQNGYQKLPGGLIIQWGFLLKSSSSSPLAVTFPIAFPSICLHVLPGFTGQQNPNGGPVGASDVTTVGFNAWSTTGSPGEYVAFIAIGK